MSIANIFSLLGGVALFLFGITLMGEGLKRVAGNKLELVLYRLSGTPLKAVLLDHGSDAGTQQKGFQGGAAQPVQNQLQLIAGYPVQALAHQIDAKQEQRHAAQQAQQICNTQNEPSGFTKI